eukprot:15447688-Alexandrium_andersonii.AAC.1
MPIQVNRAAPEGQQLRDKTAVIACSALQALSALQARFEQSFALPLRGGYTPRTPQKSASGALRQRRFS